MLVDEDGEKQHQDEVTSEVPRCLAMWTLVHHRTKHVLTTIIKRILICVQCINAFGKVCKQLWTTFMILTILSQYWGFTYYSTKLSSRSTYKICCNHSFPCFFSNCRWQIWMNFSGFRSICYFFANYCRQIVRMSQPLALNYTSLLQLKMYPDLFSGCTVHLATS